MLPPGSLACPQCHTLVHARELQELSGSAKFLEEHGDLARAREHWEKALELLPGDAAQTVWIRGHLSYLERAAGAGEPADKYKWARKLGPLAPIAVLLAKSKSLFLLFKFKSLFTLWLFLAFYFELYGLKFGVGFAVLIVIHEMGHYIDIRRRGLPADMPVFLPGLGAYVRWQGLGVTPEVRAAVSLAGPLAGWLGGVACLGLLWHTGDALWGGLARASAFLNILNLIPVWVLDGGQAAAALDPAERGVLAGTSMALWLLVDEKVFLLVAGGFLWRLYAKGRSEGPSRRATVYFAVVLTLLGVLLRLVPGQGFGPP